MTEVSMGMRNDRSSVYSVVPDSDVTPGSLRIWRELPDTVKLDPYFEAFKRYEENRGTIEDTTQDAEAENRVFIKNLQDVNIDDARPNHKDAGARLMDNTLPVQTKTKVAVSTNRRRLYQTLRVLKLAALVGGWSFLTAALIMNEETTEQQLHAAIGDLKEYELPTQDEVARVQVTLAGPFSGVSNDSDSLLVWLRRSAVDQSGGIKEKNSSIWKVHLQKPQLMDFASSQTESQVLHLVEEDGKYSDDKTINGTLNGTKVFLCLHTTSNASVPVTISYMLNPLSERDGLICATALLLILYVLIIFEVTERTVAALLVSCAGVGALAAAGARPGLRALVSWLDADTLLLLLAMMLLLAVLADTGLFDHLAVAAFQMTGGRTWPLINCLCFFTAFSSTFLDNVTTVLLMTPVTIRLCEVTRLSPVPVLLAMVVFSNVGGAATPVGDPPNVIIASHPVLARDINFTTFTLHMGLGVLLVCVQTYLQLRFMFRDMDSLRLQIPGDVLALREQLSVWRRAVSSLTTHSRDEDLIRRTLEKKMMIEKLAVALKEADADSNFSKTDPKFCATLAQMKEKYKIRDKELLVKCAISLTFVIVVFFLHAIPQFQRLSLGWSALLGALLLLLLAERRDLGPLLARVEWPTLLLFAALFVLMEVLSKLGLIALIGDVTESIIRAVDEKYRLAVAILLILWVSGVVSAFVDNIPLTTMLVRVAAALVRGGAGAGPGGAGDAGRGGLALPAAPLAWALSFGACLGGNGTLIGASANVVCAGVAEQHGYKISFLQFFRIGFPIMIGNLCVASVYLLFCHCVLEWH